jgi:hypothetical protein
VHFLDTWMSVPPDQLLVWALTLLVTSASLVIPGWRPASLASFALLYTAPKLIAPHGHLALTIGWAVLWGIVTLAIQRRWYRVERTPRASAGRFESAIVGLALGGAFFLALIVGIAREDLPSSPTRGASFALAVMTVGLLHLLLRRHIVRAVVGITTLGFGLQLLELEGAAASVSGAPNRDGLVLLGTALAAALAFRLGSARERYTGSPWLSDAHALHD